MRTQGEFIWRACLIESVFIAAILLLFMWPSLGALLVKAFQVSWGTEGFSSENVSPSKSLAILWCTVPYILLSGAFLRWSMVCKADLAEEELELLLSTNDGTKQVESNN